MHGVHDGVVMRCCAQVAAVLNEAVVLAGLYAAGNAAHQEKLHWGRAPSLLYRLCTLPSAYVRAAPQRPQLAHLQDVLLPTLVAACVHVQRNRDVVAETIGLDVLDAYVRRTSCAAARVDLASGSAADAPPSRGGANSEACDASSTHAAAVPNDASQLRASASDAATQTSGAGHCLHARLPRAPQGLAQLYEIGSGDGAGAGIKLTVKSRQQEAPVDSSLVSHQLHFRPMYRIVADS